MMDGWILFRPEALGLKGLGTLDDDGVEEKAVVGRLEDGRDTEKGGTRNMFARVKLGTVISNHRVLAVQYISIIAHISISAFDGSIQCGPGLWKLQLHCNVRRGGRKWIDSAPCW